MLCRCIGRWSAAAESSWSAPGRVRSFDPRGDDSEEGSPLPEEQGLPFKSDKALAAALALLERLSGYVASSREVLGIKRPTYLWRR